MTPLRALLPSTSAGFRAAVSRAGSSPARRTDALVPERAFLAAVLAVSVGGFWNLYLGDGSSPQALHHLHATTSFAWVLLLLVQATLIAGNRHRHHRTFGMAILLLGPLLVATSALLSVHSARRGLESGQGDAMIVQNVMATLELATLIALAFLLKRNRKVHGACLMATAIFFLGIALFFTLTNLVPGFRIEGPETFHRFALAANVGTFVCLGVGVLFFARDPRHGWPWLIAGACFLLNTLLDGWLAGNQLVQPLTEVVGAAHQPLTFTVAFLGLLAVLVASGVRGARPR